MIHVEPQPEPDDFEEEVRQRGHAFLADSGIDPDSSAPKGFKFASFWTNCLEELSVAYSHVCAYTCRYLVYTDGSRSVDHFKPKSKYPGLAYEWSNYRLASIGINWRKRDHEDVIDPFEVQTGWFQLNFLDGKIISNPDLDDSTQQQINLTVKRLKLNVPQVCRERMEDLNRYLDWEIPDDDFRRFSPFI